MEDQIQFPTPTFDDCFEQYLDEDNVRRIVPSVRVFSPVWKRCVPLVQTVRHAKGKTVQTLNLADVHELLTQHDENLVYPDSDVESRVWKEYRLLRVDYTTRKDRLTSLMLACCLGHDDVARTLITCAANVNRQLPNGNSVLMETLASNKDQGGCVKLLLETGARIDLENSYGHTALTAAVCSGDIELLKLLLTHRPYLDLNHKTKMGSTVLMLAVVGNYLNVVHFLVSECGVDIRTEDHRHLTAICWAQALKHREIAAYLTLQLAVRGHLDEFIKKTPYIVNTVAVDDLVTEGARASQAMVLLLMESLIARFMGPTWGLSGADRTQRRERLLRENPDDAAYFSVFFNQALLLLMLQPARQIFLRDGTLETLVSHGVWDTLGPRLADDEPYVAEMVEGEKAFLKMGLWFSAISCGMLYKERAPVERFIKSDLTQVFLENLNALLAGDDDSDAHEDRLLAQSMMLPVAATPTGRDWLFEQVFNYASILALMIEPPEENTEMKRTSEVCRCFSDLMESNYITYDLRAIAKMVGLAEIKRVCPDPPMCVRDKVTEIMVYFDDLCCRIRERHAQLKQVEIEEAAVKAIEERQNKHRRKRKTRRLNKLKQDDLKKEAWKKSKVTYFTGLNNLQKTFRPCREKTTVVPIQQLCKDKEEATPGHKKNKRHTNKKDVVRVQSGSSLKDSKSKSSLDGIPLDPYTCCEPYVPQTSTTTITQPKRSKSFIYEEQSKLPSAWEQNGEARDTIRYIGLAEQHPDHFPSLAKDVISKKLLRKEQQQPELDLDDDVYVTGNHSQDSIDSLFFTEDPPTQPSTPGLFDAVSGTGDAPIPYQSSSRASVHNVKQLLRDSEDSSPNSLSASDSDHLEDHVLPRNIEIDISNVADHQKLVQNICSKDMSKPDNTNVVGYHMPSVHDPKSFLHFGEAPGAKSSLSIEDLENKLKNKSPENTNVPSLIHLIQKQVSENNIVTKNENKENNKGKVLNLGEMTSNNGIHMDKGKQNMMTDTSDANNASISSKAKQDFTPEKIPSNKNLSSNGFDFVKCLRVNAGLGQRNVNNNCQYAAMVPQTNVTVLDQLTNVPGFLAQLQWQEYWKQLMTQNVTQQPQAPPPGFPAKTNPPLGAPIPWRPRCRRWMALLQHFIMAPAQQKQKVGSLHFSKEMKDLVLSKSGEEMTMIGLRDDGAEIAIHCLPFEKMTLAENELTVLQDPRLDNPFIVKFKDYAADDRYIYIATELLEGNLTSYLQYLGSVGPGECQRHTPRLVWQLFSAVSLLHGEGRVHTWLKPSHVLVDDRGNLRLSGFKFCQKDGSDLTVTDDGRQFEEWVPREVLCARKNPTSTVTLFAKHEMQVVGMLAYYIWSGGKHLYGESVPICRLNIQRNAPLMDHVTDDIFLNLLCMLLHPDVNRRMSAKEGLTHPFFWSSGRKFSFIVKFYKELEKKGREVATLCHKINMAAAWMGALDWAQKVGVELYSTLDHTGCFTSTVMDLLCFMSTVQENFIKLPDNVRKIVKQPDVFFVSLFPRVFMALYEIVRSEEQWRTNPALALYFCPVTPMFN